MGRKVAVIGAGQGGLVLALALLRRGHRVTLFADRPAAAYGSAPATGMSALMGRSVQIEQELGLNPWHVDAMDTVRVTVHTPPPVPPLVFGGRFHRAASTVDQRLKFGAGQDLVVERGGTLVLGAVAPADLDRVAEDHDLVAVAVGRGALGGLFPRDPDRSVFDRPQRALAQFYVHGMRYPSDEEANLGHFHLMPGIGEYITAPFVANGGQPCHTILLEAVPGGPLDVFPRAEDEPTALARMKQVVPELLPVVAGNMSEAELVGPNAVLRGSVTPEVRLPVGYTPGGRAVAGVGDAVVVNDPIAGQGANSATRWAYDLADHIDDAAGPLDEGWMRAVFEEVWETARHQSNMSNALLVPSKPHQLAILAAAGDHAEIGGDLIHGFEDPATLHPWFYEPEAGLAYLAKHGVVPVAP